MSQFIHPTSKVKYGLVKYVSILLTSGAVESRYPTAARKDVQRGRPRWGSASLVGQPGESPDMCGFESHPHLVGIESDPLGEFSLWVPESAASG